MVLDGHVPHAETGSGPFRDNLSEIVKPGGRGRVTQIAYNGDAATCCLGDMAAYGALLDGARLGRGHGLCSVEWVGTVLGLGQLLPLPSQRYLMSISDD
jgi:hypothetical protein